MRIGINGLELHYVDWGNRRCPPILLLHGFLSHAHTWNSLAAPIRSDYRILALDQRGHGTSDWSDDGSYSIDDHFADLAGFVSRLDLEGLVLIGHSMGGRNALFYTACRPERIRGLILVDARPGNTEESMLALKNLLDTFRRESVTDADIDRSTRAFDHRASRERAAAPQSGTGMENRPVPAPRYDPRLIVGAERAGYQVEPLWPFLEGVDCPALIIRGEKSTFVSHSEAELMNRLMPRSDLVEIRGASHLPMFQNPSAFRAAVLSFLARLRD